jgi:hypothetical protein
MRICNTALACSSPRLHCERQQLPIFLLDADPDLVFHFVMDPDPAFHSEQMRVRIQLPKMMRISAIQIVTGSATLSITLIPNLY